MNSKEVAHHITKETDAGQGTRRRNTYIRPSAVARHTELQAERYTPKQEKHQEAVRKKQSIRKERFERASRGEGLMVKAVKHGTVEESGKSS